METPNPHQGEAGRLSQHPLLVSLFRDLERNAMERAVHASLDDDATRRAELGEVRAIRRVRSALISMARQRDTHQPPNPA